jgi:dihydroxyacetone kinase-like protein
MAQTIGCDEMVRMLQGAAEKIRASHERLSKLDSFAGDGDHGTTMKRAMGCVDKAVAESKGTDLACLLGNVGWAVLGVDGGSTGPLLGTFFTGMSESVGGQTALDCAGLASALEAALTSVQKQTKAQVGDKTMMDALVPAIRAVRAAADAGSGPAEALARAAEAAETGAASTKDMRARFGRARNLGDRSIGSPDPGATSMSLIFKGFAEGLAGVK